MKHKRVIESYSDFLDTNYSADGLDDYQADKDDKRLADTLYNIGQQLFNIGRTEEAEKYRQEALTTFSDWGEAELPKYGNNITENLNNYSVVKKFVYKGKRLKLSKVDTPFKTQFFVDTIGNSPYIDLSTILPQKLLDKAVWIKAGEEEEEIADTLLTDILSKTDKTTTSGYNTYIMYNII